MSARAVRRQYAFNPIGETPHSSTAAAGMPKSIGRAVLQVQTPALILDQPNKKKLTKTQLGPVFTGFLYSRTALLLLIGTLDFQINYFSRICVSFTRFSVAIRIINRN